tara:strand:+ start:1029 stop:1466 length:438 start_codon:yes stop_codon:yes gene_type:complete
MRRYSDTGTLRDALEVWGTCKKYRDYKSKYVWWRLVSAYDNARLVVTYDDDGTPKSLMTWCFLTDDEAKTMTWYGPEAFQRDSGDQLWIIDMIANGGKSDVRELAQVARQLMYEKYPDVSTVYSLRRNKRVATFPNKGAWHENLS